MTYSGLHSFVPSCVHSFNKLVRQVSLSANQKEAAQVLCVDKGAQFQWILYCFK